MLGKVICIGKFSSREEINSVFFKSEKEVTIIVSNGLSPFSPIREKKLFWIQSKMINDRYSTDIDLMSETYSVYDHEKQENVGDFYELEVENLLNQINEDN